MSYRPVRTLAAPVGGMWVAAGEPRGPGDTHAAARAFEAAARADGARALWFGVTHPAVIGDRRPSMVIGAEPVWAAGRWPEVVAGKRSVRAQIARARNKGVRVAPWSAEQASASPVLRTVLADWLERRGLPPLAFLADPFVLDEPGARRFWVAEREGRVQGYLAAQPGDETFVEWIIQRREAPNGTAALLLDAALTDLGAPAFTLGLVPLSRFAPPSAHRPGPLVRALLAWTRAHATRFYNFGGLERFKAKFLPDRWRPLHLVTDGGRISVLTFHAVAAAFTSGSPTRFVARALAAALADEGRSARRWLSSP